MLPLLRAPPQRVFQYVRSWEMEIDKHYRSGLLWTVRPTSGTCPLLLTVRISTGWFVSWASYANALLFRYIVDHGKSTLSDSLVQRAGII